MRCGAEATSRHQHQLSVNELTGNEQKEPITRYQRTLRKDMCLWITKILRQVSNH